MQNLPGTIPPGAEYQLAVEFRIGSTPGEFVTELPLYTDCPGQTEFVLTFKGTVRQVDAARASHNHESEGQP